MHDAEGLQLQSDQRLSAAWRVDRKVKSEHGPACFFCSWWLFLLPVWAEQKVTPKSRFCGTAASAQLASVLKITIATVFMTSLCWAPILAYIIYFSILTCYLVMCPLMWFIIACESCSIFVQMWHSCIKATVGNILNINNFLCSIW